MLSPEKRGEEEEANIRPQRLSDYVGQTALKSSLNITLAAAHFHSGAPGYSVRGMMPGRGVPMGWERDVWVDDGARYGSGSMMWRTHSGAVR